MGGAYTHALALNNIPGSPCALQHLWELCAGQGACLSGMDVMLETCRGALRCRASARGGELRHGHPAHQVLCCRQAGQGGGPQRLPGGEGRPCTWLDR